MEIILNKCDILFLGNKSKNDINKNKIRSNFKIITIINLYKYQKFNKNIKHDK